ncbi:hypothetical protein PVAG01_03737 [Phlyctema vagabunda]|uniref:Uncharacterized protein n=1 Tax=Phlyctema vagabunda TaxID=108571 RepID=A0ABR4PM86_9HELO
MASMPWDTRTTSSQSIQLPSIDEGFGSMAAQPHYGAPTSVKCDTCAARGHTVWVPQGVNCPRCANNKLTPPPEHVSYRSEAPNTVQARYFTPGYESEADPLARRPSQGSIVNRPYHDPYTWISSTSSSPLTATANVSFPPSNPYHRHSLMSTTSPFHFSEPNSQSHGNKKPAAYRSEKDIRHCDAEKARRDHHSTYIEMGFRLRERFQWPEETSASSQSAGDTSASDTDQRKGGVGKDRRKRKAKDNLTKQEKLYSQVLWEFRACLRIDRERVREWLDEMKTEGEKHKERKRVLMEGHGRGGLEKGERERDRVRCVKDEAVMDVWDIMEREFWEFVERDSVGGSVKRMRIDDA